MTRERNGRDGVRYRACTSTVHTVSPKHTRLLLRAAVAAVLLAVVTHTRADPDLFGHVRFGHDMIAAGSIRLADAYSFASDRPWINHEWLAEIFMYAAYAAAGAAGLIALKLLLIGAFLGLTTRSLRMAAAAESARDLLAGVLVICTFPQTNHIRPQLFSLALFAALLHFLDCGRSRPRWLLACVPLFAAWVNLHGGWIVGGGILAIWIAVSMFDTTAWQERAVLLAVGAASFAATLLNPYGWRMWAFLYDTVGFGRADIIDWQPAFAAGLAYGLLWTLAAAAAAAALWPGIRSGGQDTRITVIILTLGVASFRVGRLVSFFAIATIALAGQAVASALARASARRATPVRSRFVAAAVLALALAVSIGAATASARNLGCVRMESELFPEPEVAAVVAARHVSGRMMTWFDWGEYAIWYFSPGVSISFDGRRETVYSEAAIERQLRFYARPDERHAVLDALQPTYVWMPTRLSVTAMLIADGWVPVFTGPQSTLLARRTDAPDAAPARPAKPAAGAAASGAGAARCFPGP